LLPPTKLASPPRLFFGLFGSVGWIIYPIVEFVKSLLSMTFATRLREERIRLGLTQKQLGEAGGVRMQAQSHYENEQRRPDSDYLAAIDKAGVDILYVITGRRTPEQDKDVA